MQGSAVTMNTQNCNIPIFVGGFRSGSTLLINLLGLHPELAPLFETRSICEALRWLRVLNDPREESIEARIVQMILPPGFCGFSAKSVSSRMRRLIQLTEDRIHNRIHHGKANHESYPLGMDYILYDLFEADEAVGQWLARVTECSAIENIARATGLLINKLGEMQVEKLQKPIWVNKTPELPRFGHELRQCLGRCKIIHMIRDGRQVVLSATKLQWGSVSEISELWRGLIEESRVAAIETQEDYLEIYYEDLIRDPSKTLDRIFVFLGIETIGQEVIDKYYRYSDKEIKPQSHGTDSLSDYDLQIFDRIAGSLQRELGYLT